MQEVVMAREAIVLCGRASVPWHQFGAVFQSLLDVKMKFNMLFFKDQPEASIVHHISGFQAQWK
jgi:hypothetical protein